MDEFSNLPFTEHQTHLTKKEVESIGTKPSDEKDPLSERDSKEKLSQEIEDAMELTGNY